MTNDPTNPPETAGQENPPCEYCEDSPREWRLIAGRWGLWHTYDGAPMRMRLCRRPPKPIKGATNPPDIEERIRACVDRFIEIAKYTTSWGGVKEKALQELRALVSGIEAEAYCRGYKDGRKDSR